MQPVLIANVLIVIGIVVAGGSSGNFNNNTDDDGRCYNGEANSSYMHVENESNSTLSSDTLHITMEIIIFCLCI